MSAWSTPLELIPLDRAYRNMHVHGLTTSNNGADGQDGNYNNECTYTEHKRDCMQNL